MLDLKLVRMLGEAQLVLPRRGALRGIRTGQDGGLGVVMGKFRFLGIMGFGSHGMHLWKGKRGWTPWIQEWIPAYQEGYA